MKPEIKYMSTALITNKVKVILSTIGISERYIACEYLSFIITYLIEKDSDSTADFSTAVNLVSEKFAIKELSVTAEIKKLLEKCKNADIVNSAQFNLNKNGIINKVRVLKNYILAKF